jgi:hypothetical protein
MLKAERTLTWMRQLISAAATLFALGVALAIPVAASAAETPVTLGPVEVSQALFVAGDVARLTSIRGGTETLVLEKVLQQMYADEPGLAAPTAEHDVNDMKALLASTAAPTQASLQMMAGNQRIVAILAALEGSYGSPPAELPAAAKLAVTHLASVALASSANVFANAESPKYFEPLADERSNLLYNAFAPATVLRTTRELARRNPLFASARDAVWKAPSEESVASEYTELFTESKGVLDSPALSGLRGEIEAGHGTLVKTPKQLEELFHESQITTQEQTCEHREGAEEELGIAKPKSGETLTEVQQKAREEAEIIAQQQAVMTSAAELLRPAEEKGAEVLAAAAQAQTQITEAEQKYASYEAEQKVRNDIKGGLEAVAGLGSSIFDFVHGDPQEGAAGLIGVAFKVWGLIEENVAEAPENPEETALKDIGDLRTQLSGFQQYTQEAFHAVNVQVAQLTAQLAQDNYEVKLELRTLTERLEAEQQTIFALQNEIQTLFSTQVKAELQTTIADSVGWLKRTGEVLPASKLQESLVALNKYATEIANGALGVKEAQPYTFEGAARELTSTKTGEPEELNESISYLTRFPVEQEWLTSPVPATLANTTFWSEGARAYAQLMLENPSHVTPIDVANLKSLEAEGLTLERAQAPWSEDSSGGPSGNVVLDNALQKLEQAAAAAGVEGKQSVAQLLEEAATKSFDGGLPASTGVVGNPTDANPWEALGVEWANAPQIYAADYPALKQLIEESNLCVPATLINGVRLGLVGVKGSGDEWEISYPGGFVPPSGECPIVDVFAKGSKTATYVLHEENEEFFPASALTKGVARLQLAVVPGDVPNAGAWWPVAER